MRFIAIFANVRKYEEEEKKKGKKKYRNFGSSYFGNGTLNLVCRPALKPGRVIRVTFSPGHPGLTRFTIYPGLTRIGSREKQNCSFDDMETYKRYCVAHS